MKYGADWITGDEQATEEGQEQHGNRAVRADLTVEATFEQRANSEGLSSTYMWGDKRDAVHV